MSVNCQLNPLRLWLWLANCTDILSPIFIKPSARTAYRCHLRQYFILTCFFNFSQSSLTLAFGSFLLLYQSSFNKLELSLLDTNLRLYGRLQSPLHVMWTNKQTYFQQISILTNLSISFYSPGRLEQ